MITDTSRNSLLEAAKSFANSQLNVTDITSVEDEIQTIVRAVAGVMIQDT